MCGAALFSLSASATAVRGIQSCVDAGAVPTLVSVLKAHPTVAAVAEIACGALGNIAAIHAGQESCVAAGAVPALVSALESHPTVAAVVEQRGCCSRAAWLL